MDKALHMEVVETPAYLHFVVRGSNSLANVLEYFERIQLECARRKIFRVLIEEHLDGPRLGMLDVFTIAQKGAELGSGPGRALAYIDVNAEGTLMRFAEDVARNRGLMIRVFTSVDEARLWLSGLPPVPSG